MTSCAVEGLLQRLEELSRASDVAVKGLSMSNLSASDGAA